jgi:phosphotriesterase-related protein
VPPRQSAGAEQYQPNSEGGKEMKSMKKVLGSVVVICAVTILLASSAFAGKVMTVLGPIPSEKMGVTLMHEHFTFAYPGWYGDESVAPYDRKAIEKKCLKFLNDMKAVGVKTVVDPSMNDTGGRDPILMKSLAKKTGMNIIASTGIYVERLGGSGYYKFNKRVGRNIEDDFYELFMKEITVGIHGTGVKAGIIKVASDDPNMTEYEEAVFRAAVRAHKATGLPITTHTEGGTVGPKQQELLLKLGANPKKIIIGHQNNSVDIKYHLSQLEKPGFYIGFDRTGLRNVPKAEDNIIELVKMGYANRLTMSHDAIGVWLGRPFDTKSFPATWYPTYIHKTVIPKMKAAGITDEQIKTILVDNPRRFFDGE